MLMIRHKTKKNKLKIKSKNKTGNLLFLLKIRIMLKKPFKLNSLYRLIEAKSFLERTLFSQDQLKKLMLLLLWMIKLYKTLKMWILYCWELLQDVIANNSMILINMYSLLGAMKDSNILKKLDSESRENKRLKLRLL